MRTFMALCSFSSGLVIVANLIMVGPVWVSIAAIISAILFAYMSD